MNILFIALCIFVGIIFVLSITGSIPMIIVILLSPNYRKFLKEKGKYKAFIITAVILGIMTIISAIVITLMDKAGVMLI